MSIISALLVIAAILFVFYLFYPEFFIKGRKYNNETTQFVESYLEKIGFTITGFYLKEDKMLNCIIYPSRKIFFTTELIKSLEKEEVLAAVLHEVGHIKNRDWLKNLVLVPYSALLVCPFILVYASFYISLTLFFGSVIFWIGWYSVLQNLVSKHLSRRLINQEFVADDFEKKNYSGGILAGALQKIELRREEPASLIFKLLQLLYKFILNSYPTHPTTEERIARLKQ